MRSSRRVEPTEADHQKAVFEWASIAAGSDARLKLLFHIANGGKRNIVVAKKLRAEGVRAGVPDLFLPVARAAYNGCFIELKRQGGRLSPAQRLWKGLLEGQGYMVCVCYGADEAINVITAYLQLGDRGQNGSTGNHP